LRWRSCRYYFVPDEFRLAGGSSGRAVALIWQDWRTGLALVGAFLVHTFITITYRAPQTVEYEMPAYVVLAVLIGYGVGWVSNLISGPKCQGGVSMCSCGRRRGRSSHGVAHAPSFLALASDARRANTSSRSCAMRRPARSFSLIGICYAMWYLQQVEGLRRDVDVRYVFPIGGQEWSQVWRSLIQENVVSAACYRDTLLGPAVCHAAVFVSSRRPGVAVRADPAFDFRAIWLRFQMILAARFDCWDTAPVWRTLSPGRPLEVTLALENVASSIATIHSQFRCSIERRTSRSQDRGYPTRTFAPGEVRVDRFTLPLEPTLAPGRYAISVGVYYVPPEGCCRNLTTRDGEQLATLTTLELSPDTRRCPRFIRLTCRSQAGRR